MPIASLMAALLAVQAPAVTPEWWNDEAAAARHIRRLPPSAFPELPKGISKYLTRRRCTIPQSAYREKRHNVIRGEFMVRGRTDWAVLCSRGGMSAILVFRTNGAAPVAEIGSSEDAGYLQGGLGGIPDFSHSISRATTRQILSYRRAFGGWVPRPLDHDGIDDSFDGKASVVLYFYKGRWVELTGMD